MIKPMEQRNRKVFILTTLSFISVSGLVDLTEIGQSLSYPQMALSKL